MARTPRGRILRPSNPQSVLRRADAPPDERKAAYLDVQRKAAKNATTVSDAEELVRTWRNIARSQGAILAKASDGAPGPAPKRVARINLKLESEMFNRAGVTLMRPVGLNFPQHRQIVKEDPTVGAIINTRVQQVQRFLRPAKREYQPGFALRFRDPSREVKDEDAARFRWLTQWLLNCGAEFDPRKRKAIRRDTLRDFIAKHIADSLTMDAAPIEIVPTSEGRTHGFVAVDGGRVFLTDPSTGVQASSSIVPELYQSYTNIAIPDPDDVIAILAWEGRPFDWYTHDNLLYPIRRPSNDAAHLGYGQPEVEDLLGIITAFLNAFTLNARGFTNNSIPQGLITLFGEFDEEDLENLKAEWEAYVGGVSNRWRLPIMIAKDGKETGVQYTQMGAQFTEMMFDRWMTFLMSIKTSLWGMDPEEVNFDSFTSRGTALSGSDTEERLASSKDKGLWPLLDWLAVSLNDLLWTVDPDVEMYWTGLDADQQATKLDEEKASTWGEYRSARGLPLTGDDILDNTPLNPALSGIYNQVAQMKMQQEQQAAMGGMPGMDPNAMGGDPNAAMDPNAMPGDPNAMMDPSQGQMTGEQQDVNSDGDAEQGIDVTGDGQADAWQDEDENGNRHFLDQDGNEWGVAPHETDDAQAPQQPMMQAPQAPSVQAPQAPTPPQPGQPQGQAPADAENDDDDDDRFAKSVTLDLDMWP